MKYPIRAEVKEWKFKSGAWQVTILRHDNPIGIFILFDEKEAEEIARRLNKH